MVTLVMRTFGGFGIPITLMVLVGSYWSKRKSHSWRQQLCDNDLTAYPRVTPDVNEFVRKINDPTHGTKAIPIHENPGLVVRDAFLSADELKMLSRFARELCGEIGLPIPQDGKDAFSRFLRQAGFKQQPRESDTGGTGTATSTTPDATNATEEKYDFLDQIRYVSDHHEDERDPRAKWGSGDELAVRKLPLPLRALNHKVQERITQTGLLRHVYIEYSPLGEFMRTPRPQRGFDGHEFVIIPFFGDDGAVITFTPTKRDMDPDPRRAMQRGWTTADIDVFVPSGSILQVRAKGRLKYAWGVRPGQPWFGNVNNVLPLGPDLNSLNPRGGALNSGDGSSNSAWWYSWLLSPFSKLFGSSAAAAAAASASSNEFEDKLQHDPSTVAQWWKSKEPRGVIVMCYEGPVSENKQRRKHEMWEYDCFGEKPEAGSYGWSPDVAPSAEDLRQEGLLKWTLRNYGNLLQPA